MTVDSVALLELPGGQRRLAAAVAELVVAELAPGKMIPGEMQRGALDDWRRNAPRNQLQFYASIAAWGGNVMYATGDLDVPGRRMSMRIETNGGQLVWAGVLREPEP